LFYGKRRSEVPKKEWQSMGDEIDSAINFVRPDFVRSLLIGRSDIPLKG
jgi:hypothetical protein